MSSEYLYIKLFLSTWVKCRIEKVNIEESKNMKRTLSAKLPMNNFRIGTPSTDVENTSSAQKIIFYIWHPVIAQVTICSDSPSLIYEVILRYSCVKWFSKVSMTDSVLQTCLQTASQYFQQFYLTKDTWENAHGTSESSTVRKDSLHYVQRQTYDEPTLNSKVYPLEFLTDDIFVSRTQIILLDVG